MSNPSDPPTGAAPQEAKVITEVFKSLHAKVRVIRDRHNISIAEAIQKFGGPAIEREYRRIVRQMNKELPRAEGDAGA